MTMSDLTSIGDVVFSRKTNMGQKEIEEIWDDTALIQAYDKAVSLAYDAAHASLKSKGEVYSETSHFKKPAIVENNAMETRKLKNRRSRSRSKGKWKVGDRCLAKYFGDDCWYEAILVKVNRSKNRCTVKFDGYESEQEQNLGGLHRIPEDSPGNEEANHVVFSTDEESISELNTSTANETYKTCCSSTERLSEENVATETKPTKGKSKAHKTMPFLPPPLPPAFLRTSVKKPSENEALASMLMSWYMNGYHTGYYQAVHDMKQNCSSSSIINDE